MEAQGTKSKDTAGAGRTSMGSGANVGEEPVTGGGRLGPKWMGKVEAEAQLGLGLEAMAKRRRGFGGGRAKRRRLASGAERSGGADQRNRAIRSNLG